MFYVGFLMESGKNQYWLGANDIDREDSWKWVDGSPGNLVEIY